MRFYFSWVKQLCTWGLGRIPSPPHRDSFVDNVFMWGRLHVLMSMGHNLILLKAIFHKSYEHGLHFVTACSGLVHLFLYITFILPYKCPKGNEATPNNVINVSSEITMNMIQLQQKQITPNRKCIVHRMNLLYNIPTCWVQCVSGVILASVPLKVLWHVHQADIFETKQLLLNLTLSSVLCKRCVRKCMSWCMKVKALLWVLQCCPLNVWIYSGIFLCLATNPHLIDTAPLSPNINFISGWTWAWDELGDPTSMAKFS